MKPRNILTFWLQMNNVKICKTYIYISKKRTFQRNEEHGPKFVYFYVCVCACVFVVGGLFIIEIKSMIEIKNIMS